MTLRIVLFLSAFVFSQGALSWGELREVDGKELTAQASQGNGAAAVEVARRYILGVHVERDEETARFWLNFALQFNHPDAQFMRALLHAKGMIYEQSAAAASYWLSQAASQGHALARSLIESGDELDFKRLVGEVVAPSASSLLAAGDWESPSSPVLATHTALSALSGYRKKGKAVEPVLRQALLHLPAWMCDKYEKPARSKPNQAATISFGLDKGEFVRVLDKRGPWLLVVREMPPWLVGWVREDAFVEDISLFGIPLHGYTPDLSYLRLPLYGLKLAEGGPSSSRQVFSAQGLLLSSRYIEVEYHAQEPYPYSLPLKRIRYVFGYSESVLNQLSALNTKRYGKPDNNYCWHRGISRICAVRSGDVLAFDYELASVPYKYMPLTDEEAQSSAPGEDLLGQ